MGWFGVLGGGVKLNGLFSWVELVFGWDKVGVSNSSFSFFL